MVKRLGSAAGRPPTHEREIDSRGEEEADEERVGVKDRLEQRRDRIDEAGGVEEARHVRGVALERARSVTGSGIGSPKITTVAEVTATPTKLSVMNVGRPIAWPRTWSRWLFA